MANQLGQVVEQLRAFVAERDWAQFHDPKNLAMAVASEAGELVAEYRWIPSHEADSWTAVEENRRRAALEAADIGIALLLFCDRAGVDLVSAMIEKMEINARHYPAEVSRGQHSRPPRA